MKYQKTNREKSRTSKRIKFWCYGCDAQIVSQVGKCPVCGHDSKKDFSKSKLKNF
jgi:rRNA maturation endonuclease Nob1